jgi:ribonuclease E
VVTGEQADAFKSVVNKIAGASSVDASTIKEPQSEPEGKTEMLNAVLESLPEPEVKAKPKRRRVSSANMQKAAEPEN